MQIDIVNIEGKKVGSADLADAVFGAKVKDHLLWEVVKAQQAAKLADTFAFDGPKTKRMAGILKVLGVESAVVVDGKENANLAKSVRNLPKAKYLAPEGLNVYDILNHPGLVIAAGAVKQIEGRILA